MNRLMLHQGNILSLGLLMAGLLMISLAGPGQFTRVSEASGGVTYGGQATVVNAGLPIIAPIVLADTGPLPPGGGAEEASLLGANVPGVLSAQVLHATTVGRGGHSRSEASVADVNLTLGGNSISAGLLMSRAEARCQGSNASVSGDSEVVNLQVNGVDIPVSGSPNQTVSLPNGSIIINEQQPFVDGNFADITVNALHAVVDQVADVTVSQSQAAITCSGLPPSAGDFVTGGGWITGTPTGAKGNFGVAGGIKKSGAFWGHLTYLDHGSGTMVKGTGITDYVVVDAATRRIEGTARVDGVGGFTYVAVVADHGEPGSADTFDIHVSDSNGSTVYAASGVLGGGNIQLHH